MPALIVDWRDASRGQRTLLVVIGILCLLTPASNFTPGRWGYLLLVIAVTVGAAVALTDGFPQRWAGGLALPAVLGATGAWAGLSLLWGDRLSTSYSGIQWYLITSSALLALVVTSGRPGPRLSSVRWVGMVAMVVVLCSAVMAPFAWVTEYGYRLALPLGGASVSPVALLVCLAALWSRWRWDGLKTHAVGLGIAGLLLVATLSRVGIIFGVVLVVTVMLRDHPPARRLLLAAGATICGLGLLSVRGWGLFVDEARRDSTANAVALLDGWRDVLLGKGLGGVWEWLVFETRHVPMDRQGLWFMTDEGRVLYHAHSVYLAFLIELGVVGLVLLAVVLGLIGRAAVGVIRAQTALWPLGVAVLLTFVAFAFETYLLHGMVTTLVWWTMSFALVPPREQVDVQCPHPS